MAVELKVPEAGESVREGQIREWRRSDGDYVRRDEVLVEIETEKAAMELPAPASGQLSINKKNGEIANVGEVLAVIDETASPPPRVESPSSTAPAASSAPA